MFFENPRNRILSAIALVSLAGVIVLPFATYHIMKIEVPAKYMAVMTKKTGENLENGDELAPTANHKGLQREVLPEGRHFRNPWTWDWDVVPQVEIPQGKLGVRIRLHGDELPYGEAISWKDNQKGIVPEVLRPGRYPINAWISGESKRSRDNYAEYIELHDPVVISSGFKGVVTNLSSELPKDPNVLLVEKGSRGVQAETLDPGTYYINPYITRISLVDCRSQRFDLSSGGQMGFPSKDGFWVSLDGKIEFRVMPEQSASVFVTYNDHANDIGRDARVDEEIINKVILPNARSFCRLRGSDYSGKQFISGETRIEFQKKFQEELAKTCESQGIQIIQALITQIHPPQQIAEPIRQREIAIQKEKKFGKEIEQQESEKNLAIEQEMVKRKQEMIGAEQEVVKLVTEAERAQEVALIEAQQRLKVAEFELKAAEDLAAATMAKGKAEANVIEFDNAAEAAGWKKAVGAFDGDGNRFARWVMLKKLAPSFRAMMVNTADSPIMDIFEEYDASSKPEKADSVPVSKSKTSKK